MKEFSKLKIAISSYDTQSAHCIENFDLEHKSRYEKVLAEYKSNDLYLAESNHKSPGKCGLWAKNWPLDLKEFWEIYNRIKEEEKA